MYLDTIEIMKKEVRQHLNKTNSNRKTGRVTKKKNMCQCIRTTSVTKIRMPILNIHIEHKIKGKKICTQGNKIRREQVKMVRDKFHAGEGSLYKEAAATKEQERNISLVRMWHYIDTAAYLIKQNGNEQELGSLCWELLNLVSVLKIGREQIIKLIDADNLSNINEEIATITRIVWNNELTLRTERNIIAVQVNIRITLSIKYFRKMAYNDNLLNTIKSFTGEFHKHLNDALTDARTGKHKDIIGYEKAINTLIAKANLEIEQVQRITHTIELNSPFPKNIQKTHDEIQKILDEVITYKLRNKPLYSKIILNTINFTLNCDIQTKLTTNKPIFYAYKGIKLKNYAIVDFIKSKPKNKLILSSLINMQKFRGLGKLMQKWPLRMRRLNWTNPNPLPATSTRTGLKRTFKKYEKTKRKITSNFITNNLKPQPFCPYICSSTRKLLCVIRILEYPNNNGKLSKFSNTNKLRKGEKITQETFLKNGRKYTSFYYRILQNNTKIQTHFNVNILRYNFQTCHYRYFFFQKFGQECIKNWKARTHKKYRKNHNNRTSKKATQNHKMKCFSCSSCKRPKCKMCIECNTPTLSMDCLRTKCLLYFTRRQRILYERIWLDSVYEQTRRNDIITRNNEKIVKKIPIITLDKSDEIQVKNKITYAKFYKKICKIIIKKFLLNKNYTLILEYVIYSIIKINYRGLSPPKNLKNILYLGNHYDTRVLWKRLTTETPHRGNAPKTAFEEFPFYFGKSLKTGKG